MKLLRRQDSIEFEGRDYLRIDHGNGYIQWEVVEGAVYHPVEPDSERVRVEKAYKNAGLR